MHGRLWSGCGACVVHSEWVVLLVVTTLLLLTMAGTTEGVEWVRGAKCVSMVCWSVHYVCYVLLLLSVADMGMQKAVK